MKPLLTGCLTLLSVLWAGAQTPSDAVRITTGPDTVAMKTYAQRYNPRKALLYAAVLPGAGQIYNKKYWKLPLVYGGFIATGYAINFYQDGYQQYKGELFDLLDSDEFLSPSGFTEDQLRTIVDRYRRQRDFMIIVMAGVYVLQMIDAHVDAHLKEFDLNPDLHVRVVPATEVSALTGRSTGVSLLIRF
jgi:hypothetical protein